MLQTPILCEDDASDDWAQRSQSWLQSADAVKPKRHRHRRNPAPLILTGHGASLRIEHGALAIRDGFTHHPQEQIKYRYFPGDLDLPTRILLLDGSGTLSFDVLSWLAEQGVALARIKWSGEVAIVASGTGYAADRDKVRWQNETRGNNQARLAFSIRLITDKITASIDTLERYVADTPKRGRALHFHRQSLEAMRTGAVATLADLRGVEGQCARRYFAAWEGTALNWTGRRPIPPHWRTFTTRGSMTNGLKPTNQFASHPINAILNYAYAVKAAQLQIRAIADGYDPTIGIMHNMWRGKPAYVFDLIEGERPKIDAAILIFIEKRSFASADFVLRNDGVCRLSPQLARMVASLID